MNMEADYINKSDSGTDKENITKRMKRINKLSYILISLNFGMSSLADLSIQYFCKDVLKLQPSELSRYITFTQIPWVTKPLFGLLTDSFPIFGKRRKYYIILCGFVGFLAWFLIAFFANSLFSLIMFLTLMNASLSFSSVLGEAIVVELSKLKNENNEEIELQLMKKHQDKLIVEMKENLNNIDIIADNDNPNNISNPSMTAENEERDRNSDSNAKDFISLFFFFKYTGALISSLLKGHMIKYLSYCNIFLITGSLSFLTVVSGMIFIEENNSKNHKKENSNKYSEENHKYGINNSFSKDNNNDKNENELGIKYKKLTDETSDKQDPIKDNYSTGMDSTVNFDKKKSSSELNGDAKTVSFEKNNSDVASMNNQFKDHENIKIKDQLKLIFKFLFQKYILIPTLLLIIFMSTPSYDDPFFYFFTEELKLNSVDLGLISTFSIIFTLIAILIYKWKLKKYSFKTMIIGCSLVSFVFSFMSYVLTKRYNLVIGIPDIFLILFSTSVNSLLGELTLMPMLSLACLLSPKNLEGTAYSIFMSALNLGGGLSIIFGSYLTQYMGITSTDFKNLPNMILISNLTALLPLPLIWIFGNSYFSPESSSKEKEISKSNEKFIEEVIDVQPIHSKNI